MKTKEFIKQVEELSFHVREIADVIHIRKDAASSLTAHISITKEFIFDTNYEEYKSLDVNTRGKLLDLIVEYVSTPLKDREDPKKYYLRLKGSVYLSGTRAYYLNLRGNLYFLSSKECDYLYKTQFTQSEIDNMPKELLEAFDQIEVEDED